MIKIYDRIVEEDIVVMSLEGKLSGLQGRGAIQEKLKRLSEDKKNKVKNVILNLSRVSWIDSTGLGELIASLSSIKKMGGNLVLADIPGPVESLLKMTNLHQIFDTYDDVETALGDLQG
ncbi:MAG: STAS domain-containing protein [bacterium]